MMKLSGETAADFAVRMRRAGVSGSAMRKCVERRLRRHGGEMTLVGLVATRRLASWLAFWNPNDRELTDRNWMCPQ